MQAADVAVALWRRRADERHEDRAAAEEDVREADRDALSTSTRRSSPRILQVGGVGRAEWRRLSVSRILPHSGIVNVAATEQHLRLADLTIALRSDDVRIPLQLSEAVQRFATPAAPPDLELVIGPLQEEVTEKGELLFDSGSVWKLFREQAGYRVECRSVHFGDQPYKIARFDEKVSRGEIGLSLDAMAAGVGPLDYPIDEVLVTTLLARRGGVELHGSGIVDRDGRGHLFVGQSGAGKSTMARLWDGRAREVLSDDRVIVRERNGEIWMYGTPWHGEAALSSPTAAPLVAIYLLKQAAFDRVTPLAAAEAAARLLACAFPPFYDALAVEWTVEFLGRLSGQVAIHQLEFTRSSSVIDLLSSV